MIDRIFLAVTIAVVMAAGQPASAADAARQLSGSEVARRFSGMELTDEAHWAYVFARAGMLTLYSLGKKTTGHWHVDSNKLCMSEGQNALLQCYAVWISGTDVELRPGQEASPPLSGVLMKQKKHNL